VRILRVFKRNTSDVRISFIPPSPPERELKFQMQAMTHMMERLHFVMENVYGRLDRMEKRGNEASINT
jgi:hypothetical protein